MTTFPTLPTFTILPALSGVPGGAAPIATLTACTIAPADPALAASSRMQVLNAEEVLVRDPNDTQSNSIMATGGLRLATRALANLGRQNGLSGSLQKESMELARVLRERTGNDVLFSTAQYHKSSARERDAKARIKSANSARPKAKADDCKSGDPFCTLK